MRDLRTCLIAGLTAAAIITAAACSNDLAAPSSSSATRVLAPSQMPFFSRDGASSSSATSSTVTVTFTINPNDDNYIAIGPHLLVIPANEVCDPSLASTGYGVGTWNLPCTTIKHSLKVTATATTSGGHPLVTFDTHLRFKPVSDDRKAVWLYLRDQNAGGQSTITWCPDGGGACVDETLVAPAMKTHWDYQVTTVYRKILHFSGYNVTGGRDDGGDTGVGP